MQITGGRFDAMIMVKVASPVLKKLMFVFGGNNFLWARVAYLAGLVSIVIQTGVVYRLGWGVLIALVWVLNTALLFRSTNKVESQMSGHASGISIPTCERLIASRGTWLLMAGIFLPIALLSPIVLLFEVGLAIQALGAYFATNLDPPGTTLWALVRKAVAKALSANVRQPLGAPA